MFPLHSHSLHTDPPLDSCTMFSGSWRHPQPWLPFGSPLGLPHLPRPGSPHQPLLQWGHCRPRLQLPMALPCLAMGPAPPWAQPRGHMSQTQPWFTTEGVKKACLPRSSLLLLYTRPIPWPVKDSQQLQGNKSKGILNVKEKTSHTRLKDTNAWKFYPNDL